MSEKPTCYGKEWEAGAAECNGGIDPSYKHPLNGSSRRDRCNWYGSCAAATNANRSAQAPIPASRLTQPQQPVYQQPVYQQPVHQPAPPPPNRPAYWVPQQPVHQQPQQQAVRQQQPQPGQYTQPVMEQAQYPMQGQQVIYVERHPYTQPQYAQSPNMVPMNTPQMECRTESFVMVPEPNDPDVPWVTRALRSTWRASMKAGLMQLANFYDYNPIGQQPLERKKAQ